MVEDSSFDLTAVLLGLEERIAEKISQQFAAFSDRLEAVLALIPAEPLLAVGNQAGNQAVAIVASSPVSRTVAGTLQGNAQAVATQDVAVTALTGSVLAAEALADAASATATQEALATHPAHAAVSNQQKSLNPGEYAGHEGVTAAAGLACKAVLALGEQLEREGVDNEKLQKLHQAHRHLQTPVTAVPAAQADHTGSVVPTALPGAQAYDFVREIRKSCSLACEAPAKFAALAVRETLILHICCSVGTMTDIGFENALETAFGRRLGPELRSQLHLARSAICRLGRDVTVFQRAAPKKFGSQLHPDDLKELFISYSGCTDSIGVESGACALSQQAKSRRKKNRTTKAAECAASVEASMQVGMLAEAAELSQARLAMEPQWITIDSDTGHVIGQAQSSWDGETPFHEMIPRYLNFETQQPLRVAQQVKPLQWLVSERCYNCGSKDTCSWACIDGLFYCERCWGAQFRDKLMTRECVSADAILFPAFGKLHVLKANSYEAHEPGGVPERFAYIAPVVCSQHQHTEVVVTDASMLEVAAQAAHDAVLLWSGEDTVIEASTFGMALEVSWLGTEIVSPELGGFYVPEVMVYRHSDGHEFKPFRTAMVYAAPSESAPPDMSPQQLQQYLLRMKEEIRNALRMCSLKGHDEIVLGAWGCDGASPCAESIAELFFDALLVNIDVARRFRKVTFAISKSYPEDRRLDAFRTRFDNRR